MTPHPRHRLIRPLIRLLVATVAAMTVLAAANNPAAAGGWAVGSLDSMPTAIAGETAEVGFTILQHGVTPAELSEDVGIEIVGRDGSAEFFPAAGDGRPGHYVATVTFPESSGTLSWSIRMGWFGSQVLGSLDVGGPPAGATSVWPTVRWGMLALSTCLAGVAIADVVLARRRARIAFR